MKKPVNTSSESHNFSIIVSSRGCRIGTQMNNDDTFLDLLSSQRKLLAQIAQENSQGEACTTLDNNFLNGGYGGKSMPSAIGFDCQERPLVMHNQTIAQRQSHFRRAPSKRHSLDLRDEMINVPPSFGTGAFQGKTGVSLSAEAFGSFQSDALLAGGSSCHNYGGKKRNKGDFGGGFDDFSVAKKRRFSGAGYFFPSNELPFSHSEESSRHQRRFSMSSIISEKFPGGDLDDVDGNDLLHTFDTATLGPSQPMQFNLPPQPATFLRAPAFQCRPVASTSPILDHRLLVNLSDKMEKSQKSQQDIHDWDKKMGLKRSHSKTMRLSMRSRKKLRAMLKKKINAASKRC